MPVTITRAQRDAIYQSWHLTVIGDAWISVRRREFADAKKMGREFAEELRLLEDLEWSETIDRGTVTLTVPPEELIRTLTRLHRRAAESLGVYVSRPKDDEERAERDLAASETLGAILGRARGARRRAGGALVSAAKPISEEAVAKALAPRTEMSAASASCAASRWPAGITSGPTPTRDACARRRHSCSNASPAPGW